MQSTHLKPRRVIGWDVDDTLFRSGERMDQEAFRLYGVHADPDISRREGIDKAFPTLSKEQVGMVLRISWENPDNPPRLANPRIPRIFDEVSALGFQNAIVTGTHGNIDNMQLVLHNVGIPYDHFEHVTSRAQKVIPWVLALVDDSARTAVHYGEAGRAYLWLDEKVLDPDVRERALRYKTVFPIKTLDEVPKMLAEDESLRGLIKSKEADLENLPV